MYVFYICGLFVIGVCFFFLFSGTFITTDINIRRFEDVGTIELYETVRKIRSQRAFSIQVPDQYVFCHLALIEYAVHQGLLEPKWLEAESESESD